MTHIRTRFAPSPTGYVHVGNVRAALFCFLYAKAQGGDFILRLDDTDAARSTAAYAAAIEEDLQWLSLVPDEVVRQSDRFARYGEVFETLRARGLVYACYETPEELSRKRKRLMARGLPPVYDRAALALSEADHADFAAQERPPHWRFKLSGAAMQWHDMVRGEQKIETASLSDPVLMRADGTWLYTLPSVVDDSDMNISHVIRGEDHVSNTAVQLELMAALDMSPPHFAHTSLLVSASGEGLSKRHGAAALRDIRGEGIEPMSVNSVLARLGTADAVAAVQDMATLISSFDMARLGRAPARFDIDDVRRINAHILRGLDYETARPRLAALDAPQDPQFWQSVRGNLAVFSDVADMARLVAGAITPVIAADDADFIATARAALPAAPLSDASWQAWTQSLKQESGRQGRALFMPLRLALTGQQHGPEMKELLPLIGYEKAMIRLNGETG